MGQKTMKSPLSRNRILPPCRSAWFKKYCPSGDDRSTRICGRPPGHSTCHPGNRSGKTGSGTPRNPALGQEREPVDIPVTALDPANVGAFFKPGECRVVEPPADRDAPLVEPPQSTIPCDRVDREQDRQRDGKQTRGLQTRPATRLTRLHDTAEPD